MPEDHQVRRIAAVLDFAWVRTELAPHYSHTGRPSIDPELMIRMLILGYVPEQLEMATAFAFQPARRLNLIDIAVDVEPEQRRGMIAGLARSFGLEGEVECRQIQLLDECIGGTHRIVLIDIVVDAVRQEGGRLRSSPSMKRFIGAPARNAGIIPRFAHRTAFSHSLSAPRRSHQPSRLYISRSQPNPHSQDAHGGDYVCSGPAFSQPPV